MTLRPLKKIEVEAARGEIFHMILFAMAWVMIGEYAIDFRDYVVAAGLVLVVVVILAFYSINLYNLEDSLPENKPRIPSFGRTKSSTTSRYAAIFILEGIAIMATWIILIRTGHQQWLVPGFALIAGLHFFPLARVIRVNSYFLLGAWITVFAIAGYWLVWSGRMAQDIGDAFVSYSTAAGAVADGAWIAIRTEARAK
jgi:hypothetical protein